MYIQYQSATFLNSQAYGLLEIQGDEQCPKERWALIRLYYVELLYLESPMPGWYALISTFILFLKSVSKKQYIFQEEIVILCLFYCSIWASSVYSRESYIPCWIILWILDLYTIYMMYKQCYMSLNWHFTMQTAFS